MTMFAAIILSKSWCWVKFHVIDAMLGFEFEFEIEFQFEFECMI